MEYGKHEFVNKGITNVSSSSMVFTGETPKYFFAKVLGKHPLWVTFSVWVLGCKKKKGLHKVLGTPLGKYLITEIVYI